MPTDSPAWPAAEEAPPKRSRAAPNHPDAPSGYVGKLVTGEPLGRYTTFRIGGPAQWYAEPAHRDDLARLLPWARERELPLTVLGGGSNLLVSDCGVAGLVIRLSRLKTVTITGCEVVAEAGLPLTSFLRRMADQGLAGLEGVVGVPGAVGGALVMNAGTPQGEFGDPLVEAELLFPDGAIRWVPREYLSLAYRRSGLKARGEILLSVRLQMTESSPEAVHARMKELDANRHASQPLNWPSAGCVWKNPKPHTAGKLVDEAGLKGERVGGAEVSTQHANFIINRGDATANDVTRLMRQIRQRVHETSGALLEPELQLMGDHDWES